MSISLSNRCSYPICFIGPPASHTPTGESTKLSSISAARIFRSSAVAFTATLIAQLASAPVDVISKLNSNLPPKTRLLPHVFSTLRAKGATHLFSTFPLHSMKRLPTKTLTVILFELCTQSLSSRQQLSPMQSISLALSCGASALTLTYPLHLSYYAMRKGLTFASVLKSVSRRPRVLSAGLGPAIASTMPGVLVDYSISKSLRKNVEDKFNSEAARTTATIIGIAMLTKVTGSFFAEPFKAMSKRAAVDAVKGEAIVGGIGKATQEMMNAGGVGEFWRGFRAKSVRYSLSAVVSKATAQKLQSTWSESRPEGPRVVADSNERIFTGSTVAECRFMNGHLGSRAI